MGYENAPATALLATHCACCNLPLVAAVSVEVKMGPVCREKHGYNQAVNEENAPAANKLIHFIAAARVGDDVNEAVEELRALGFDAVADRIVERLAKAEKAAANSNIVITDMGDSILALDTPYRRRDDFIPAIRKIPGRRWNSITRTNTFPVSSKRAVWDFLKEFFPGKFGRGPKGVFQIPKQKKAAA